MSLLFISRLRRHIGVYLVSRDQFRPYVADFPEEKDIELLPSEQKNRPGQQRNRVVTNLTSSTATRLRTPLDNNNPNIHGKSNRTRNKFSDIRVGLSKSALESLLRSEAMSRQTAGGGVRIPAARRPVAYFPNRPAGALAARLVETAAPDVAHPFDDVMVGVVELGLEHLQVAHLEARRCEWYLTSKRE